jgi:hypothetical protein
LAPPAATREKGFNLQLAHILGVAHGAVASVSTDKKASPIEVSFLSLRAIVQVADALTELVKQAS